MKNYALVVAAAAACLGMTGFSRAADTTKKGVTRSAADLKWIDNPSIKGAQLAVLWGDPKTGAYGVLKRISGGTDLGMHWHTHDQKSVMVSGTITFTFEGESAKDLGAGSYTFIPGGQKHSAICKAGSDCEYFEESVGAADFMTDAKK
jgi:quercetin dioxygenase-like cupin family protein